MTATQRTSQYPVAPLKTLCVRLMLAGVIMGSMQVVYADDTCTAPCSIDDSGAHTLTAGTSLSSDSAATPLSVSNAGRRCRIPRVEPWADSES